MVAFQHLHIFDRPVSLDKETDANGTLPSTGTQFLGVFHLAVHPAGKGTGTWRLSFEQWGHIMIFHNPGPLGFRKVTLNEHRLLTLKMSRHAFILLAMIQFTPLDDYSDKEPSVGIIESIYTMGSVVLEFSGKDLSRL